jgi:NADH-quinone oxidoreductase subunit J
MQSVLNLLGSFVAVAAIYLLAGFQFLAAAQILVYAGAIMVLFIFVVMLLNLTDREESQSVWMGLFNGRILGSLAVFAGLTVSGLIAANGNFAPVDTISHDGNLDNMTLLAEVLFSKYMLPFEAASLLLLATLVGVMLLAKRERNGERHGAQLSSQDGGSEA